MSRDYPERPLVGIGVCVLRDDAVLLIRRGNPPNLGSWALPGGGQELSETAEACARRELAEETGLAVGTLYLAAIVDSITTDDTGRVRYHYTIIDYAARWQGDPPCAGGDATEIAWAPFHRLADYELWSEALRVIAIARALLNPAPGPAPD